MSDTSTVSPAVSQLYTRSLVIWGLFAAGLGLLAYMALSAVHRPKAFKRVVPK
jgi:hypothetical protein